MKPHSLLSILCLLIASHSYAQNSGVMSANLGVNYAPTGISQIVSLSNFQTISLTLIGLDANNDTLTFAIVTGPTLGSLSAFDPVSGEVNYTPEDGMSAADTFTFSVSDGLATSNPTTVMIMPPAMSTFSPSSVNFGKQGLASATTPRTVTVRNSGIVPLTLTSMYIGDGETDFGVVPPTFPVALLPGKTAQFSVTFTPSALSARAALLAVASNAVLPISISLSGIGVQQLTLSASALNFGTVTVGSSSVSKTVTLTNNDSSPIGITAIVPAGDYSLTTTCTTQIASKGKCATSVIFTPTAEGTRNGSIMISDSATNSPQTITLKGIGK